MRDYSRFSQQIISVFWGLISTCIFGLCLYFGLDIWNTGSLRVPDFINGGSHIFNIGEAAKPVSLLLVGFGGLLALLSLVSNIWEKLSGFLLTIMYCLLGSVFVSIGATLAVRSLERSNIPEHIYLPGLIGAALLLLFGVHIIWTLIRKMIALLRA